LSPSEPRLSSGPIVGFVSGTLAAISMATIMATYLYEHPKKGVEF
jgi:hypothetical protein